MHTQYNVKPTKFEHLINMHADMIPKGKANYKYQLEFSTHLYARNYTKQYNRSVWFLTYRYSG